VLNKFSKRAVGLVLVTLALVASCGDNVRPVGDVADGGAEVVDAPVADRRDVSTLGSAVHASSSHYRLHGSLRSGETASASAHYHRSGLVTGGVP
jgi:predicted small secreted protein